MLSRQTRVFAVLVVLLVGFSAWAVRAVTTTGGDQIKRFEGVQVAPPDSACTIAFPNFEDMPAMTLPFDMKHEGQVVVLFQGQFGGFTSSPDARAVIRFTVDGLPFGSAAAIGNDHGSGLQTFGYNAFGSVSAGSHELKVVWHTAPLGATSCVEERSLILLRQ
jgi:hypothetical protein